MQYDPANELSERSGPAPIFLLIALAMALLIILSQMVQP